MNMNDTLAISAAVAMAEDAAYDVTRTKASPETVQAVLSALDVVRLVASRGIVAVDSE